jgi:pimeloyl-ACP methyl ester carboxylesterase
MDARVLAYDSKGQGQPVVLVPGGLTGWLSWVPHQARLAERYRAIRVQPIHNELGSAGLPGDAGYTYETEREALRLTLDELGLGWVHLAGWSGGGRALLEFAMEYPERVRSLALVEPAAYWILEQLGDRADEVQRIDAFMHGLFGREVTEADLADFLVMAGFADSADAARADPGWERWAAHRMALSWQGPGLDRPRRSLADLALITCPAVLFKGSVTTDWEKRVVDALGERLPEASVVELAGDHASHIQSIDVFLDAFESHLRRAD